MDTPSAQPIPNGWDTSAHQLWTQGQRQQAIPATVAALNRHGVKKPLALVLQMAYYLYLMEDAASAAQILEHLRQDHPREPDLLRNLAVCLTRCGRFDEALARLGELVQLTPNDPLVWDSLAHANSRLGRFEAAAQAGTQALQLKDQAQGAPPTGWQLPDGPPAQWLAAQGQRWNVIAFSLWGDHPRYLRGALDNALAAKRIYPGWVPRYYVDASVPADLVQALVSLDSQVKPEADGQSLRQKLAWRFQVANDPNVGRFLVRDVDSVVNARERSAVDAWLASDRWFHVMRDWWTHTDLMLAGMWGGVAGVLPDLSRLLQMYVSPALETPNIDQWFLRDVVWRLVRGSCLVHDRCFKPEGAQPWPQPAPGGVQHVGQDVFAAELQKQARRLAQWHAQVPSLQLHAHSSE